MEKTYDNEMRGSLWNEKERKNDKSPIATGTITISGVELRIAMWPKRKAGGTGKRAGDEYWPMSVEYKQGTKFILAKVNPANVIVTGAAAVVNNECNDTPSPSVESVDDMPF